MRCLLCGEEHAASDLFDSINGHINYIKYQCVDCEYGTASLVEFVRHRDQEDHRMSSECFVDHFYFEHLSKIIREDFEYAEKHGLKALERCFPLRFAQINSQIPQGKCMMCSMVPIDRNAVHEHINEHLGYQPHKCSDCPFKTGLSSELEAHRHQFNHCVQYRGNLHHYFDRLVDIISQDMFYLASNENTDLKLLFAGQVSRPLESGEELKQEVEVSEMEAEVSQNRKRHRDDSEVLIKSESDAGEQGPLATSYPPSEAREVESHAKRHRRRSNGQSDVAHDESRQVGQGTSTNNSALVRSGPPTDPQRDRTAGRRCAPSEMPSKDHQRDIRSYLRGTRSRTPPGRQDYNHGRRQPFAPEHNQQREQPSRKPPRDMGTSSSRQRSPTPRARQDYHNDCHRPTLAEPQYQYEPQRNNGSSSNRRPSPPARQDSYHRHQPYVAEPPNQAAAPSNEPRRTTERYSSRWDVPPPPAQQDRPTFQERSSLPEPREPQRNIEDSSNRRRSRSPPARQDYAEDRHRPSVPEPQTPSSSGQRSRTPHASPQTSWPVVAQDATPAADLPSEQRHEKKRQPTARVPHGSRVVSTANTSVPVVNIPCKLCVRKDSVKSDYLSRRFHTLTEHLQCDDSAPDFAEILEATMRRCFPQQLVNSDHECNKCGKNCSTSDQRHKHIHTAHAVVKLIRCPVGGCTTERTKPTDLRNHIDTVHQTMTRPEEEAFARLSTDYYESLRTEMNTCFPLPLPKKNTPKAPTTFNAYGGVRVLANMMGGIVGKIYTEQKSKKIVFESSDSEDEGPPTEFKKSPPPSEVDPSENRDHTPQRGQEALNRSNRQPTRGGRTYQPSPPSSSFGAQNSGYRGHSGGRGGYGGRGGWRRGSPRGRGGPSSPYRGGH